MPATAPRRGCGARRSRTSGASMLRRATTRPRSAGPRAKPLEPDEEVYEALCLGLRDYVDKNGFERVLLGLSGGIDSALTACVAADALGSDRVACAVMPSPHSSPETQSDARTLADNLGIERFELRLEPLMEAYDEVLAERVRRAPSRASRRRTSRPGSAATC